MVDLLAAAHQQAKDGALEAVFVMVRRRDGSHGYARGGRYTAAPEDIVAPALKCLAKMCRIESAQAKC